MGRPRLHTNELRDSLLAETTRTVAASGVSAVSLRELATRCGTSTSAVYSLFGGKTGLLAAVHSEVLTRFRATMEAVPVTEDPLKDLMALAHAYRNWSTSHPELRIVLATSLPDAHLEQVRWPLEPVESAVRRALDDAVLSGDPDTLVDGYITTVHGFVDLDIKGLIPEDRRDRSFTDILQGWIRAHHGTTSIQHDNR